MCQPVIQDAATLVVLELLFVGTVLELLEALQDLFSVGAASAPGNAKKAETRAIENFMTEESKESGM